MFPSTKATLHTLENGLTVILDPDSSAPVISTQIWVETGSIHEGRFMGSGISHMLEHMVFKGTESFSGEELSKTVQAAGGQWNAYTSFDRTVYYIDGPASSAETFLKALSEMVFKPSFPEEEFEKEKDVIRREIDMGLDDPDSRASQLLFSTAFADDARSQPVIGHLELFNQLSHADMREYHAARYTTDNCFISIAGDFIATEMLDLLKTLVADIPRQFTQPVLVPHEDQQLGKRIRREHFAIPASKLTLAWQVPSLSHPDAPALDLLSTILGGGRSSRLYHRLREQKNLCHHIASWAWITHQSPGLFSVSAEVAHDQRDQLQQAILEEIHRLSGDSLDSELKKAKRICLVSQFKTLTTASGRASDLASNWHETRTLNFTKDYIKACDQVNAADIRRVCQKYLFSEQTLTVTSLDPNEPERRQVSTQKTHVGRQISSHTLSNGLQLHLCADKRLPMVSLQAANAAGMLTESTATAGTSTLLSTLLTKGTTTRSALDIANTLESLGARLGAMSGNNTAAVSASCLSQDLPTVLDIFADSYANPSFSQEAIELERKTQLHSLLEEQQDPVSLAFRHLRAELFNHSGYGINRLGSKESLTKIDRLSLSAHHSLHYTAKNTNLAIFGDIDPDKTIELAEKHLSQIHIGNTLPIPTQSVGEAKELNLTLDKQQAILTLGYPSAGIQSDDLPALDLLHAWCSDMAGPLFSRIREDLGLAYFCSATQFHGRDTGMFAFYLGTSPEQLGSARSELLDTINQFSESGITAKTLDSVKRSWLASQDIANQSNAAMARFCAIDTTLGFTTEHHTEQRERIQAISPADILAVAQKYFAKQKPTIVTVTP